MPRSRSYAAALTSLAVLGTGTATAQPAAPTQPAILESSRAAIEIEADGTATLAQTIVIRIDTPEGAQAAGVFPVPLSTSLQSFELIEAFTTTPEGQRVAVRAEDVLTQSPPFSPAAATLSDLALKVIAFPQVSVGARLTASYRIRQTKAYLPDSYFLPIAALRHVILLDGRGVVSVPAGLTLGIDALGAELSAPRTEKGRTVREWRIANPTFQAPEPAMVSPFDAGPAIMITTLPNWRALADRYQQGANAPETPGPKVRELAAALTHGVADPRDKAARLYDWVRTNINYVNIVLGTGGYVPKSADEVLERRFGDCKGQSTLLIALLRSVGIDASAALVSAQPLYREPAVAFPAFDHLIVYMPSLDTYADPTARYVEFGNLPSALDGKFTVLTKLGTTKRIADRIGEADRTVTTTRATLNADGTVAGFVESVPEGDDRVAMRESAARDGTRDPAEVAGELLRSVGLTGTGTLTLPKPDAAPREVRLKASYTLNSVADLSGPAALRVPLPIAYRALRAVAASANQPPRTSRYSCSSRDIAERTEVRLPATVKVAALPKPVDIRSAGASYTARYVQTGDIVTIERHYVSQRPAAVCTPEHDAALRPIRSAIDRDLAAPILTTPR